MPESDGINGSEPAAAATVEVSDEPSSRRRSRWGNKTEGEDAVAPTSTDGGDAGGRKRSRWGTKKEEPSDPLMMAVQMGIPLATLQHMSAQQQESLPKLKQRVDEIDVLLRLPDCGVSEIPSERRSPSPEPVFDRSGMVVNTREVRKRQALEKERQSLLDSLKPKPPGQRQWRKIIVPIDKYPGYNFFGAIIGPRGNAQKRMERESGCKIVVRGKGAIKDGCGRHDGRPLGPEDEEPMHVLIEGPDEETVEAGQKLVEQVRRTRFHRSPRIVSTVDWRVPSGSLRFPARSPTGVSPRVRFASPPSGAQSVLDGRRGGKGKANARARHSQRDSQGRGKLCRRLVESGSERGSFQRQPRGATASAAGSAAYDGRRICHVHERARRQRASASCRRRQCASWAATTALRYDRVPRAECTMVCATTLTTATNATASCIARDDAGGAPTVGHACSERYGRTSSTVGCPAASCCSAWLSAARLPAARLPRLPAAGYAG